MNYHWHYTTLYYTHERNHEFGRAQAVWNARDTLRMGQLLLLCGKQIPALVSFNRQENAKHAQEPVLQCVALEPQ